MPDGTVLAAFAIAACVYLAAVDIGHEVAKGAKKLGHAIAHVIHHD